MTLTSRFPPWVETSLEPAQPKTTIEPPKHHQVGLASNGADPGKHCPSWVNRPRGARVSTGKPVTFWTHSARHQRPIISNREPLRGPSETTSRTSPLLPIPNLASSPRPPFCRKKSLALTLLAAEDSKTPNQQPPNCRQNPLPQPHQPTHHHVGSTIPSNYPRQQVGKVDATPADPMSLKISDLPGAPEQSRRVTRQSAGKEAVIKCTLTRFLSTPTFRNSASTQVQRHSLKAVQSAKKKQNHK